MGTSKQKVGEGECNVHANAKDLAQLCELLNGVLVVLQTGGKNMYQLASK